MTNFEANKIADDRLRALGWDEDSLWEFSKLSFDSKSQELKEVIAGIESEKIEHNNAELTVAMQWEIDQLTIALGFWAPAENLKSELSLIIQALEVE